MRLQLQDYNLAKDKGFLLTINIEEYLTAHSSGDAKTNVAKQKNMAQQEPHSKEINMSKTID